MCDYWADRYERRSPSERSCLETPLAEKGIRLLRELPRDSGEALLPHTDLHALASRMALLLDLDVHRILRWFLARAVEASPYWNGMAKLAVTLDGWI